MSYFPGFITQPNSAAVQRPVRHRQRSMASCLASATAIFFFKDCQFAGKTGQGFAGENQPLLR